MERNSKFVRGKKKVREEIEDYVLAPLDAKKTDKDSKGYFMGEFIGLEATVKDAKRFAKEPGNWSYFTFSHAPPPYPAKAKMQPTAACNGACHAKLSADDWVFTQYYPALRAAKGK